jgi:hypothetical protein
MIRAENEAVVQRLNELCPEVQSMGIQFHVVRKGSRY